MALRPLRRVGLRARLPSAPASTLVGDPANHPATRLGAFAEQTGHGLDSRGLAAELDARDEFAHFRDRFSFPAAPSTAAPRESALYFCGNSLGLMPWAARESVMQDLDKWATTGVDGHFTEPHPWVTIDESVQALSADMVGALPEEVAVMNSLTVNLHLMMVSFYRPTPTRCKILVEPKAFPSDMHMLQSQVELHGLDPNACIVPLEPRPGEVTLRTEDIVDAIGHGAAREELALVMLSGVQYYTGQLFDIRTITHAAHAVGVPIGWDLAHAVGNVPLDLHDDGHGPDFAAWCTYKYLNAGPGGIAGCFVHERHARDFANRPRLKGWWGHCKSDRFDMSHDFRPSPGAQGFMLSNPPALCCASLRASLEVFEEAGGPGALRHKAELLTGYLELLLDQRLVPGGLVRVFTPREVDQRGCQLSLHVPHGVERLFQALSEAGVVCDMRKPDVLRLAPAPLYNSYTDVWELVQVLERALSTRAA